MSLAFLRPGPPPSRAYVQTFMRTVSQAAKRKPNAKGGGPAKRFPPPPSATTGTGQRRRGPVVVSVPPTRAGSSPTSAARTGPLSSPTSPPPSATAAVSAADSSPTSPPPAGGPPPPAPTSPLAYHVHRTASQQLPVYHDYKRGGSLRQTVVRRVTGDADALRADLQAHLGLEDAHAVVNPLTGHVVLKGQLRLQVAEYLRSRHF